MISLPVFIGPDETGFRRNKQNEPLLAPSKQSIGNNTKKVDG
jgi:hypothetical protein